MESMSLKKIGFCFLFLYLFFISFLNFTIFYRIVAIIMIVIALLRIIRKGKITLTKYFYFELIFILYNILFCIFGLSINTAHTKESITTLILNLSINFGIMNLLDNTDDVKKIIKYFIPISIFSSIYIILYTGGTGSNGRLGHGVMRPFGETAYTSMEFSSWALYAGTISLFYFFKTREKKYLVPLPLFWIIVIWSGSRKWLVFGILLQVALYFFYEQNINIKKILKKGISIILILILFIFFIFTNEKAYNVVGYRIIGFFDNSESSAITRNIMKEIAIEYIKENPIKGYGLNTFRDVSIYDNWSESNYLELLFGCGIFVTIFYYGFWIYIALSLFKIRKYDSIYILFFLINMMLIISDVVSMSYLGRLESFMITISSLLIYFNKKESCEVK